MPLAPLRKGSCPASSRTEGLPPGREQGGGREPFPNLRTEPALRAAPVFRMAYSAPTAHCAVFSETLMLQVRSAHPPMPHRTSSLSCSGVSVGLLSYLRAIPPFGALAFRSAYWLSPHHPALRRAGVPFGLLAAPNARTPVASRPTASPNAELQSLRDLRQAQTLDLQVRSAHPPNCTRPAAALDPCTIQDRVSLPRGVSGAAVAPLTRIGARGRAKPFPSLRTEQAFQAAPVFRSAY